METHLPIGKYRRIVSFQNGHDCWLGSILINLDLVAFITENVVKSERVDGIEAFIPEIIVHVVWVKRVRVKIFKNGDGLVLFGSLNLLQ